MTSSPRSDITPEATVTITYTATLTSPLHHGAGTAGNTSLLRTQEVVQPDGTVAALPFLSAASIRHALRDRIAWHIARILDIEPGSLTKQAVDLLWSGGAVTSTGAETDLDLYRRVDDLLPSLTLFGYAARADITEGILRASDAILVCAENSFRLPAGLPQLDQRAAVFRGEEFGTRHDVADSPVARLVQAADTLIGAPKTTQMIFDLQVLKPGAVLHGDITLTPAATGQHRMVLGAALALWAPDGEAMLGAKTATGYGRARIDGLPDTAEDLGRWTEHLLAHRDNILALVAEVAG
jgi:hypothetical protein